MTEKIQTKGCEGQVSQYEKMGRKITKPVLKMILYMRVKAFLLDYKYSRKIKIRFVESISFSISVFRKLSPKYSKAFWGLLDRVLAYQPLELFLGTRKCV